MEVSATFDLPNEQECPVCKDHLKNPCRLSSCMHVFCSPCLIQSLTYLPHCPVCRTRGNIGDIQNVPSVRIPAAGPQPERPVRSSVTPQPNRLRSVLLRPFSRRLRRSRRQALTESPPPVPPVGANPTHALFGIGTLPVASRPPGPAATPSPAANHPTSTATPVCTQRPALHRSAPPGPHPRASSQGLIPSQSPAAQPVFPTLPDPLPLASMFSFPQLPYLPFIPFLLDDSRQMMTFECPYCNMPELNEINLRDHCNENHRDDNKHVVCPICASLPHGNPLQLSANFIGHLNLRHSYFLQHYTNIHQNNTENEQDGIMQSYRAFIDFDE